MEIRNLKPSEISAWITDTIEKARRKKVLDEEFFATMQSIELVSNGVCIEVPTDFNPETEYEDPYLIN